MMIFYGFLSKENNKWKTCYQYYYQAYKCCIVFEKFKVFIK